MGGDEWSLGEVMVMKGWWLVARNMGLVVVIWADFLVRAEEVKWEISYLEIWLWI